jgi:hypothetical protein
MDMTTPGSANQARIVNPDTVTEAVAFLTNEGYHSALQHLADEPTDRFRPGGLRVDYTFRFEGPTDPSDAAIVMGVSWPETGRKAVIVSAYGPTADSDEAALLTALAAHQRSGGPQGSPRFAAGPPRTLMALPGVRVSRTDPCPTTRPASAQP